MDTVTSYFTFAANDKARASQVNANFNNYRGTLIPIDPNTAAAAGNLYDLGTTEHRWRGVYAETLDLEGATTSSHFSMVPDTASTAGSISLKFGSTTAMTINNRGVVMSRGISGPTTGSVGDTTGYTTFMRLSITSSYGNWIQGLLHCTGHYTAGSSAFMYFTDGLPTVSGGNDIGRLRICRDTTTSVIYEQQFHHPSYTTGSYSVLTSTATNPNPYLFHVDVPPIHFIDPSASAGGHTYIFQVRMESNHTNTASFQFWAAIAFAMEMHYR